MESDMSEAFMFRAGESILGQLTQAGKLYWDRHFNWKLQSMGFIDN
jgi:hypothetical protein